MDDLIPLTLQQGLYRNGTPYTAKNRWVDANLIRWHDGAIRPIGGWVRRNNFTNTVIAPVVSDPTVEAVRDMVSWTSNDNSVHTLLGTNLKLYYLSPAGAVTDVTPVGVTTSSKDAVIPVGFGMGSYGAGPYGMPNYAIGIPPIPMVRWSFSPFGEVMLATQRGTGKVYEFNLSTLVMDDVTNAPSDNAAVVVTAQRIVMVLSSGGDYRKVSWSDQENRTVWNSTLANQAGDIHLAGSGKLLAAVNVMEQVLILGENDAYVASYIKPPYVYSFSPVGQSCGPISPAAVVSVENFAVWWGERSFWIYDGAVKTLQCEVIDYLYETLETTQESKITAVVNAAFSEVTWYYQSADSTTLECDHYVTWNYLYNHWVTGRLDRTTGVDKGDFATPVYISTLGEIYNHEIDILVPDGDVYIESGPVELGNGKRNLAVQAIFPDTQVVGTVNMTIYGRAMPTMHEYVYGPYIYNNPTPTRALGRQLRFRFQGLPNTDFEIGSFRASIALPTSVGVR